MEERRVPDWEMAYRLARDTPSDINEHIALMKAVAEPYDHITEFGVRGGVSTRAWIAAQPRHLHTYDKSGVGPEIGELCEEAGVKFKHTITDTMGLESIELTDLLFIDTLHTYKQLSHELSLGEFVQHLIIVHDTKTYETHGQDSTKPGLKAAIEAFTDVTRWHVRDVFDHNNGLTVIEKI